MIINSLFRYILIGFFVAGMGCQDQKTEHGQVLPDYIRGLNMENLKVLSLYAQVQDTIILEEVAIFESNENVFIEGMLSGFEVDDWDRVYNASTQPGSIGVYVFNPDGRFLTRFAQHGRGPGEYESISSIELQNDQLYLLDQRLQKFGIFFVHDYSHIKDVIITRDKLSKSDSLARILNIHQLSVTKDKEYILRLRMIPRNREFASQKELYYKMSGDGTVEPGKLLELRGFTYYYPPKGELAVPFLMPFNRSKLVSITNEGYFYTAWTEKFLIKKYDPAGNYISALYYPLENASFSKDEIVVEREIERALDRYELPGTWPVLHTMEIDDEERIWVAAITDDDSSFHWWVLDKEGDFLARFVFPGKRAKRSAYAKPLIIIKGGHFYIHEQDFREGIDRIVKYKINLVKR